MEEGGGVGEVGEGRGVEGVSGEETGEEDGPLAAEGEGGIVGGLVVGEGLLYTEDG